MPGLTYLSDSDVREGRSVSDDTECDDLLQELRRATGEDWIILTRSWSRPPTLRDRLMGRAPRPVRVYTLYADCHGEWQVMNLVTASGGSILERSEHSREHVMNYMLGYVAGLPRRIARAA